MARLSSSTVRSAALSARCRVLGLAASHPQASIFAPIEEPQERQRIASRVVVASVGDEEVMKLSLVNAPAAPASRPIESSLAAGSSGPRTLSVQMAQRSARQLLIPMLGTKD